MKRRAALPIFLLSFCSIIALSQAPVRNHVIEVFDFHSTHRCMTCNKIEQLTRDVLERHFGAEVKSGRIVFKIVNVDEKENTDIAKEFGAWGTSLFIRIHVKGKTERINLTEFAFLNVNKDDHTFAKRLTEELRKALARTS